MINLFTTPVIDRGTDFEIFVRVTILGRTGPPFSAGDIKKNYQL